MADGVNPIWGRIDAYLASPTGLISIAPAGGGVNLLHGTAPFHVVVATTTLWHIDAAIAGPFHISKSRQVKGKWPDQPLDHHSGCPS
jgi:hypothetical protein